MYIPQEDEIVKYLMYSNSQEIDVLYMNETFYLSFNSMLDLFKCTEETLEAAFELLYEKEFIEKDNNSIEEMFYSYTAVLMLGNQISKEKTNRFSNWVETTLKKYRKQQTEDKQVYMHDIKKDFSEEVEMYVDMDPEEGIRMEVLTRYLNRISDLYSRFVDKLIEIENKNSISIADVVYLDTIDLCFIDRMLDESAFFEFGNDIEKTIYKASLSRLITKLSEYMGDNRDLWSEKIESLRVKVIQEDVECKQMFYFLKRFGYYVESLSRTYENIVNPSFIAHFEPEFNFWDLCAVTSDVSDLSAKRVLFVDAKIRATKWLIEDSSENDLKTSCEDYIERCQQSIDLIDYEIKNIHGQITLEQNIEKISKESENKDFTTRRQVLAIYFIFNELGVRNIDKTVQARFIQFLTNKNQSNIYKILSNPFKGLDESNTKIKDDLLYVKNLYDELGLSQLSKKIDANMQI